MFLLWSGLALAAPACPDVADLVQRAQSAFDEAEVEGARTQLAQAYDALACQEKAVSRDSLLAMYHLDALASSADEDGKAALFAIIRAVTLDPDAQPPQDVGPELLAQHATWADRIREDRVRVSGVDRVNTVWIDGVAVTDGHLDVVTGEHFVQVRGAQGWNSEVVELSVRGDAGSLPILLAPVPEPIAQTPVQVDPVLPPPPRPVAPKKRKVSPGIVSIGAGLAAVGGGGILGGYLLERRFAADPYADAEYGGCKRADACYGAARADQIGADARTANALYIAGYGLTGVGVGIVGMELFVLRTAAGSSGVGLRGRW
ncbi:MAG: hypothetical protein AB8H79_23035 [Myxococcota bacterium]